MAKPLKERLHRQAQRQLPRLMREQGGRCHYCQRPVVHLASIPEADRIRRTSHYIYYLKDGQETRDLVASTDHKLPLGEGGDSRPENVVLSCELCNNNRTRQRGPETRSYFCARCGGAKQPNQKFCKPCRRKHSAAGDWPSEQKGNKRRMEQLKHVMGLDVLGLDVAIGETEHGNIVLSYQSRTGEINEYRQICIPAGEAERLLHWLSAFIARRNQERIPRKLVRVTFTRSLTGQCRHTTYFEDKQQTKDSLVSAVRAIWADADGIEVTYDITPIAEPCREMDCTCYL